MVTKYYFFFSYCATLMYYEKLLYMTLFESSQKSTNWDFILTPGLKKEKEKNADPFQSPERLKIIVFL